MPPNRLLSSLRQGRPIIGTSFDTQDELVAESLSSTGLDFIDIDMQHGAVTIDGLRRALMALRATGLPTIVRPLWNDPPVVGQILDLGADGLIVPMVNSAEEARRAVAATRYPPTGTRSWGPFRAAALHGGDEAYMRDANDSIAVFVQVETVEAVKNLDAILSVTGLNGVVIGPADLAISLGYGHDRQNRAVLDTMQSVLDRCLERGVPFGLYAGSVEIGAYWLERGGLVIACCGFSTFIAEGVSRLSAELGSVRDRLASRRADQQPDG